MEKTIGLLTRRLAGVVVLGLLLSTSARAQVQLDQDTTAEDKSGFLSAVPLTPDTESTAGATSPTGTKAPPRVGPNVRVNATQAFFPSGLVGRSETTVAATDDGQFAVAGFNDAQGFCGTPFGVACTPQSPSGLSGFGFTTDGGLTWTDGGAPPILSNSFSRGDPWLDRGGFDQSTFYYANLAVHETTGAGLGVSVHRGHFTGGGFSWEDIQLFNSSNPNDFYDKEAIAAAKDGSGTAYVSLTNFIELCGFPAFGFGQIEVWRTSDSGATWLGPAIAGPDATFVTTPGPGCGSTGVLQQSSSPAIGPNGEVYVVWQFGPTFSPGTSTGAQIRVARSLNGGVSFDTPVPVASINSMRNDPPVGYNRDRINDHPRIAVATSGPFKGRVYVVFYSANAPTTAGAVTAAPSASCPLAAGLFCRAQRLTSSQIFLSFSDDQGATWSTPAALAPAVPATGVKRLWPVVNVEPGGNVDVIYYESQETSTGSTCQINVGGTLRRRGSASSLVDTFWVQSANGGASFSTPTKVSTATSNWCTALSNIRPNFGDYIGAAVGGNRIFASWADSRNGVVDTFHAQILAAGKSK